MYSLYLYFQYCLKHSRTLYGIRILISLAGVTLGPWWIDTIAWIIPLTLGVAAGALTDLDDRLIGRLRNILITLLCFFIASVSTEILMPYPWLFMPCLLVSTWGFTMLAALGQYYATIAFGALLIAIYTMLGKDLYDDWYLQPMLLLTGTLWYNLIALIEHLFFPARSTQDSVAANYLQLAHYLDAKASLFKPAKEVAAAQDTLHIAIINSKLTALFNQTKQMLLTRLKQGEYQPSYHRMLAYYFIAQDIHEQASAIQINSQIINNELQYADIFHHFQRLLTMQATACRQFASSIQHNLFYIHNPSFEIVLNELTNKLTYFDKSKYDETNSVKSLRNFLKNVSEINLHLTNIDTEQTINITNEPILEDERGGSIKVSWFRIKSQLTPDSTLFRHAVRMSLVLSVGYLIIQLAQLQNGYWIMLTSLFVCQPNYNSTKNRLKLRMLGTLMGVFLGLPILYFISNIEWQLLLIVVSGVLFFTLRHIYYAYAIMFITFFILLCFNLVGEGFNVAIPRIVDTFIGCIIAWVAVSFIWPDWRFRSIYSAAKKMLNSNSHYLMAIIDQYHHGKNNTLNYRIARRNSHNSAIELVSIISTNSSEANRNSSLTHNFRLLSLNHELLSYLSALGAHRSKLIVTDRCLLNIDHACMLIGEVLNKSTSLVLEQKQQLIEQQEKLVLLSTQAESNTQFVIQQLISIIKLLPELFTLIGQYQDEKTTSK